MGGKDLKVREKKTVLFFQVPVEMPVGHTDEDVK